MKLLERIESLKEENAALKAQREGLIKDLDEDRVRIDAGLIHIRRLEAHLAELQDAYAVLLRRNPHMELLEKHCQLRFKCEAMEKILASLPHSQRMDTMSGEYVCVESCPVCAWGKVKGEPIEDEKQDAP